MTLQKSAKPNHYVLTDPDAGLVLVFEKGRFNESQKITDIHGNDPNDFMKVATSLRMMGDWMVDNYPELL